jgi:ABC-type multidrug transport system ATPase subunit
MSFKIIKNPEVLFFDEPTTGLDSFLAQSLVKLMNSLALSGKIVVCTIHQPSSQVFELFEM